MIEFMLPAHEQYHDKPTDGGEVATGKMAALPMKSVMTAAEFKEKQYAKNPRITSKNIGTTRARKSRLRIAVSATRLAEKPLKMPT